MECPGGRCRGTRGGDSVSPLPNPGERWLPAKGILRQQVAAEGCGYTCVHMDMCACVRACVRKREKRERERSRHRETEGPHGWLGQSMHNTGVESFSGFSFHVPLSYMSLVPILPCPVAVFFAGPSWSLWDRTGRLSGLQWPLKLLPLLSWANSLASQEAPVPTLSCGM